MSEKPPLEQMVKRALEELIRTPSDRDKQKTIGPSDMSDPCNRCLAFKMAGTPIPQRETLFAWHGTGKHIHVERSIEDLKFATKVAAAQEYAKAFFGEALTEVKVPVCTIPGYGEVHGHIDLLGPWGVVDWKTSSVKKLLEYKKKLDSGVIPLTLQQYSSQLTLYMGAARRLGYNIDEGVLAFIPRDSVTESDFWYYPVHYSEANEQALIQRATNIYQWVKAGRHEEIASDPDCYTCHPRYYG